MLTGIFIALLLQTFEREETVAWAYTLDRTILTLPFRRREKLNLGKSAEKSS
jgi:hypothetical protein